jgi:hypothetical protein
MKGKEKYMVGKPRPLRTLWNHKRMLKMYMHITIGMK